MAYIRTEDVARIRQALKVAFPEFRFSVRKGGTGGSVHVAITSGPVDFHNIYSEHYPGTVDVNQHHTYMYGDHQELFEAIIEVIKNAPARKWYDNSNAQIDFFDTAFYYNLTVGRWNKPYEVRYPKKGLYHVPESYMEDARTALAMTELT